MVTDTRGKYERATQEAAPKWLRRGDGDTWLGVFGQQKDDARRYLMDAMRNWFAGSLSTPRGPTLAAANDALIHIASNMNIDRFENLTDDQFRAMLLDAWPIWQQSGTPAGIIKIIRYLGFTGPIAFMPVAKEGRWEDGAGNFYIRLEHATFAVEQNEKFQLNLPRTRDGMGVQQYGTYSQTVEWDLATVTPPFNICEVNTEPYWDYFNYIWDAFYIVIGQPHPFTFWSWGDDRKWGQPDWGWNGVKTGDQVLLRRLIIEIQKYNAGHCSCRGLLFQMGDQPRRIDTVAVTKNMNNQPVETITVQNIAAVSSPDVWASFNYGDGTRYGQGFCVVRMYEDWEVNDDRVPNQLFQW